MPGAPTSPGAQSEGRVLAFWRDRCLVAGRDPVDLAGTARDTVFLGADGTAVFAADLSGLDETAALRETEADAAVDIRGLFPGLDPQEAATLAYARGMLHWTRNQRFCVACGGRTDAEQAGHVRRCRGCDKLHFPRIEPAVIMLVEAPDRQRCLLARHRGARRLRDARRVPRDRREPRGRRTPRAARGGRRARA